MLMIIRNAVPTPTLMAMISERERAEPLDDASDVGVGVVEVGTEPGYVSVGVEVESEGCAWATDAVVIVEADPEPGSDESSRPRSTRQQPLGANGLVVVFLYEILPHP